MPLIEIPDAFRKGVLVERGDAGAPWLARLPDLVEHYCRLWNLSVDGAALHGYIALVVPVSRAGEPCILKLGWLDQETGTETAALRLWNGSGAVKLLDSDANANTGALLLERLDTGTTLSAIASDRAAVVAGSLLRRLAVTVEGGFPSQKEYACRKALSFRSDWERLNRPLPEVYMAAAESLCEQLQSSTGSYLVDWDLHYENVLAGEREPWLAIDPKVSVGDVEFGVAQLLWNRFDYSELPRRFRMLVEAADLDDELARAWTTVRLVDYWLWALGAGLTKDPLSCSAILGWLLGDQ